MKNKKGSQCWLEIIVVLIITFLLFLGLVLMYEEKIDELENYIKETKENC